MRSFLQMEPEHGLSVCAPSGVLLCCEAGKEKRTKCPLGAQAYVPAAELPPLLGKKTILTTNSNYV
jgi:hypothetical protein